MDEATPTKPVQSPPKRPGLSPRNAFLLAIGLGLSAGFLDVGFILLKKLTLNPEGSYRNPRDFPWTVPLGHVVLLLVPAVVLAASSRLRPRLVSFRVGASLLAMLGLSAALLRLPLYPACSLALAFGAGCWLGDALESFAFGPRRGWVRRGLAAQLGLLLILFALTTGRQVLLESRAVAGLPPAPTNAPNVLLVVWDTVRASNLSLYGYPRETTPKLERWAARGVRFNRALAPAPWTIPSHASFLTGRYPMQIDAQWKYALDTPDPTLAEFLSARGYQTVGFAGNTNCCNYETDLDRGFLHYEGYDLTPTSFLSRTVPGKWISERVASLVDYYPRKWISLQARGAREINDAFLGWLGRSRPDRPFFAFLNYFEAHEPYIPPAGFSGRFGIPARDRRDYETLIDYVGMDKSSIPTRDFNMVRDCYDDCIAFLDEQLDRLLNELERRGVLENTVVVITSDHGEGFGDHGICGHAYSVFMEEVGVPLVILAPGTPRGRADYHPVSLRDLPATVVDLLGLAEGTPFPGRSLAECWRSSPDRPEERLTSPAFSEQANEAAFEPQPDEPRGKHGFQMSLVTPDGIQYIRTGTGVEIIFNLWTDPRGLINLAGTPEGDALLGPLRASLLEVLSESRGTDKVEAAYLADYRRELANLVRDQELSRIAAPRSAAARQGSSRRSGPVREPVDATSATASGAFR